MNCCGLGTFRCNKHVEGRIYVDKCIYDDIVMLRKLGIDTKASCCGHGKLLPTVCVDPNTKSSRILDEMGYRKMEKHIYILREEKFK